MDENAISSAFCLAIEFHHSMWSTYRVLLINMILRVALWFSYVFFFLFDSRVKSEIYPNKCRCILLTTMTNLIWNVARFSFNLPWVTELLLFNLFILSRAHHFKEIVIQYVVFDFINFFSLEIFFYFALFSHMW